MCGGGGRLKRRISVIVPVLNEADNIVPTLDRLQVARGQGHEIVVVDGGSLDRTVELARPLADRVLHGARGRARQMNQGAQAARGEILWFVHADTLVPPAAAAAIVDGLQTSARRWGRFDVRLSGSHPLLRVIERMMTARSRLTSIATGDQGIFVRRAAFEAVDGYRDIPLMEDVALSRVLKRRWRPLNLRERVVTSSRRWEQRGIVATIVTMWMLRAGYAVGVSPRYLAQRYYGR